MIAPRRPVSVRARVTPPQQQTVALPAEKIGLFRYALAFALPLTTLLQVQLVGVLSLHDLLTPITLMGLLISNSSNASLRPLRTLFWLLGLWLFGQVLTDLVMQSVFEDYARGWLRIMMFALNLAMLWLLSKGRMGVLACYLAGTGVAAAVYAAMGGDAQTQADPWKFGVGSGLAFLTAAICEWGRLRQSFGRYFPAWLFAFLALLSLWNNSRSLFAVLALAAAYFTFANFVSGNPKLRQRVNPVSFGLLALVGIGSAQVITLAYENAASSGLLGEAAYRKYAMQAQADVSLLVGGRTEVLVSLQAIADRPILGHGSWAKDPYYVILQAQRMIEVGLVPNVDYHLKNFGALIPTHSHLFGSWVEAGVLGALPWLWALTLVIVSLYRALKVGEASSAMVVLTAFMLLWDVLFSPFGTSERFVKAAQICILIAATRALRPAISASSRHQFVAAGSTAHLAPARHALPRRR